MLKKCPVCGKEYTEVEEDAYYLTDSITLCECCGEVIEKLLTSDRQDEIDESYQYVMKKAEKVESAEIKECLSEILEQIEEKVADPKGEFFDENSYIFSTASGKELPYVVLQVTLKEKLLGTGSRNLTDLERVINHFAAKGYRLHTMSTVNSDSKGFLMGDRIQATLVFEKKNF